MTRVLPPTPTDVKAWQRVVGATEDGNPGAETQRRTIEWLRAKGWIKPAEVPTSARDAVVRIARAELGPQHPDRYWAEVCPAFVGHPHDVAWCGGFALWCLRKAGLCDWSWQIGKGFLFRLTKTNAPEAGDIAYFEKGQHHAIVERCEAGQVWTIDGNSLTAPAEGVTAKVRKFSDVTAFYSIRSIA